MTTMTKLERKLRALALAPGAETLVRGQDGIERPAPPLSPAEQAEARRIGAGSGSTMERRMCPR